MPPLAASQVSLRDPDTGLDVTTLSVDPTSYQPFQNPNRGSSHQVLDGTVIHQFFGLQPMDITISMDVEITDYVTMQALWTKTLNKGKVWELRDFFNNKFKVIFSPGEQGFNPTPIRGSCDAFECTLRFRVTQVVQWFGASYA